MAFTMGVWLQKGSREVHDQRPKESINPHPLYGLVVVGFLFLRAYLRVLVRVSRGNIKV